MSYVRALAVLLWLMVSCALGLIACLFSWAGVDANVFASRLFAWGAFRVCNLDVRYEGLEHLAQVGPCVLVANHQTGVDVATYGNIVPRRTKVIGKTELKWIPFFGLFLWLAGNILIKRHDRKSAQSSIGQAAAAIRERGVSVWIFPEGTRNKTCEGLLPFKKGAFHMAIAAGVPIVPIVSSSLKNVAILETPDIRGGKVRVRVLPPIPTQKLTKADVDALSAAVRAQMLEAMDMLK